VIVAGGGGVDPMPPPPPPPPHAERPSASAHAVDVKRRLFIPNTPASR
jgi:hypothetical protein